jgi:uncharacterized membrane protein
VRPESSSGVGVLTIIGSPGATGCSSKYVAHTTHEGRPAALQRGPTMSAIARTGSGSWPQPGPETRRHTGPEAKLAEGLGWFSLGLGVPQILAPGAVNRLIGVRDDATSRFWQRVVGIRELAAAAGILGPPKSPPFLWARVMGDIMDLALLASAFGKDTSRIRLDSATASVAAVSVADTIAAMRWSTDVDAEGGPMHVTEAITVRRPRSEVYAFWHDFQNLPTFTAHLRKVEIRDGRRSHWESAGPRGRTMRWDAEIVEDQPDKAIAWRSLPGADVPNRGRVSFRDAPGGRGTEVRLEIGYDPPGGGLASTIALLFGEEPRQQVRDDLRRFKQVMETGEVVRSDGTPEGMFTPRLLHQRPARPLETQEAVRDFEGSHA